MILTDGVEIFGEGETQEAAIANAVATCLPQNDGEAVTREWIAEQLRIAKRTHNQHGLFFDDAD